MEWIGIGDDLGGVQPTIGPPGKIYLAQDKRLAASSISVAVAALRFLYTVTLRREWTIKDDIPTCRQPHQLPDVLSPKEVAAFLEAVKSPKQRVILTVCYAAGLRVSEAVQLKPAAIDSQRMVIRVEAGKGRSRRQTARANCKAVR
jgi:integrase/recombinase XerD